MKEREKEKNVDVHIRVRERGGGSRRKFARATQVGWRGSERVSEGGGGQGDRATLQHPWGWRKVRKNTAHATPDPPHQQQGKTDKPNHHTRAHENRRTDSTDTTSPTPATALQIGRK